MRILFLWTLYDSYVRAFYDRRPGLSAASFSEQQIALLNDFVGWPGYLARALGDLGCQADVIFGNVQPLQKAWARERGLPEAADSWQTDLPQQQIREFRPDVLLVGASFQYWGAFLRQIRESCGKIFLWIASPLPKHIEPGCVDGVLSSFPHYVTWFQSQGLRSEFFQPACFDPAILQAVTAHGRDLAVTFIGGLDPWIFRNRIETLSYVGSKIPLQIWGYGLDRRVPRRPHLLLNHMLSAGKIRCIRDHFLGEVYGLEYFGILARSLITLNIHIDVAQGVASNMRLFEATGCGAMLMTEKSIGLAHFFEPGSEVVTFENKDDLVAKATFYLSRSDLREQIAQAGQKRTLTQYTSHRRAEELVDLLKGMSNIALLPASQSHSL